MGSLSSAIYSRGCVKKVIAGGFDCADNSSGNIALSESINPQKSIVIVSYAIEHSYSTAWDNSGGNRYAWGWTGSCAMNIVNANTLHYQATVAGHVEWQVIEFY